MVTANLVGSVTMLLVGMGLLYVYLRRYEGHFDQARLFFALIVGLFLGAFLRFMEQSLFGFEEPCIIQYGGGCPPAAVLTTSTLVYSLAYTAMGYAMLEAAAKTAVLGLKKFRTRPDAPFHGASLGIGLGAMWSVAFASLFLVQSDGELVLTVPALLVDALVLLLASGILLANAAAGVWVGRGAAQGSFWRGLMFGTLWQVPSLAFYWAFRNIDGAVVLAALLGLAYGLLAVQQADRRVLQATIPPEVRDQLRRQERRDRRKAS